MIEFDVSEGLKESEDWWLRWMIFCNFNFNVGSGFINKIKHIYRIIMGRNIWGQAEFSAESCKEFATWMLDHVKKLESQNPDIKMDGD